MRTTEEHRQQMITRLEADIAAYEKCAKDEFGSYHVVLGIVTVRQMVELLKKLTVQAEATWVYYTNDEGKARWRCSACGKVCKRNPYYKQFCSQCGSHMRLEA